MLNALKVNQKFSVDSFDVFNVTLVQIQCILPIALLLTRSMNALVGIFQP